MWELYDALISEIPTTITVQDCCAAHAHAIVLSDGGTGVAMSVGEMSRPPLRPEGFMGQSLKVLAECVKSWNFAEASLGLAAINAWYNSPQQAQKSGVLMGDTPMARNAFVTYQEQIAGKKVAVVGHFPFLETRFAPICQLSILERAPKYGDYPDTACEYLLPEQDYVFITGVTIINKTLPRLLALSPQAKVILVGPSVPLAPQLFAFGVAGLESFIVDSPEKCAAAVRQNIEGPLFSYGRMVSLNANL